MGNKRFLKFVEKANKKFKNKFDYSKFEYISVKTKGIITCPIHGDFLQNPDKHLQTKYACQDCWKNEKEKISWYNPKKISETRIKNKKKQFIKKCKEKYGKKYIYDLTEYKSFTEGVVKIICPIHGETYQIPKNHIVSSTGCRKCGEESSKKSKIKDFKNFLDNANKIHYSKYTYPDIKTLYINRKSKIVVNCKKHGNFKKMAQNHLSGQGCFKCNTEKLVKNNKLVGGYSNELFLKIPELKNKKAKLYYLSINNGKYFKIGITTTSISIRINSIKSKAKKYKYNINKIELIKYYKTSLFNAFNLEQKILENNQLIRKYKKWSTELFSEDIIEFPEEIIWASRRNNNENK